MANFHVVPLVDRPQIIARRASLPSAHVVMGPLDGGLHGCRGFRRQVGQFFVTGRSRKLGGGREAIARVVNICDVIAVGALVDRRERINVLKSGMSGLLRMRWRVLQVEGESCSHLQSEAPVGWSDECRKTNLTRREMVNWYSRFTRNI
ncbi:hypothetical protein [Mycobacterium szulgai]|uniref:hypothetical protein n=1 Tax=Mycobacterium szulgai TaxID=1787 RepID=UPI001B8029D0|nr:hypothetical protein [Mycobacterium szulgai]